MNGLAGFSPVLGAVIVLAAIGIAAMFLQAAAASDRTQGRARAEARSPGEGRLAVARALLVPGIRTRGAALAAEAKDAALLALGTAPWLALAGFIEGYVGRTGLGAATTTAVGIVTLVVYWGLVVGRGR